MFRGSVGFKKDKPFIPTPGVYRDQTNGLISFSIDSTNWITMKDKNIGATSTDTSNVSTTAMFANVGNLYSCDYNTPITYNSSTIYDYNNFVNVANHTSSDSYHWQDDRQGPCDLGWHIPDFLEMCVLKQTCSGINNIRIATKYVGCLEGSILGYNSSDYGLGRAGGTHGIACGCDYEDELPYYKYNISQGGIITEHQSYIDLTIPGKGWNGTPCSTIVWRFIAGESWKGNVHYNRCATSLCEINNYDGDIMCWGMREGGDRATTILPIRPFKDTPVIPTRDWTVLYSTPQSS